MAMLAKKNTLTAVLLLLIVNSIYSQAGEQTENADKVLKTTLEKLLSLKQVRYQHVRESKYTDENYHNVYSPEVYFDFTENKNLLDYQFQSSDSNGFVCYNGAHLFTLSRKNKTMSITKKPERNAFENISPLYNSLVTLRTLIPTLLTDKSISKTIADTSIANEGYYFIKFELFDKYIGNLGSLKTFTKEYIGSRRKPYLLLINKKTFLPYQFITLFKDRANDFIAATFSTIDTHPEKPGELSWYYSSYANEYSSPKPSKQLIAEGSILGNWSLPFYNGLKTDSLSLYDYKGKLVMLDFWIKSCGPCIASFPKLNELQKEFGTDKFQLLSINAEDNEDDIKFFYEKHKPGYKMVFGAEQLAANYGVPSYPTVIIVDKTGKVIYTSKDGFNREEIDKVIKANL